MKKHLLEDLFKLAPDTGAEGTGETTESVETTSESEETDAISDEQKAGNDSNKKERTFTREQLARIVKEQTEKARKEALQEAEKLAGMNEMEKIEHENEQLKAHIEELKRKENLAMMAKEASNMFATADIKVNDGLLDLVVKEDAEQTKEAVQTVIDFASQLIKANARQNTPIEGGNFTSGEQGIIQKAELAKQARKI